MNAATPFDLFVSLALATFLEAAPFLLLGSIIAVIFDAYVSDDFLLRRLPRGRLGAALTGLLAGMVLPTCECGVAPIARRMITRGAPPGAALAYMLAAPVINPLVLTSTYVAFRGDWSMVLGRVLMVAAPALLVGLTLGGRPVAELLRGPNNGAPGLELPMAGHGAACACGCGHDHGHLPGRPRPGALTLMARVADEFLEMGKYLILGCLAAAAIKAFAPPQWLSAMGGDPILAVLTMMGLAILLSVCSEADAFVAASFVGFPPAAMLAFVGVGPMVDLKLLAMYGAIFRGRAFAVLVAAPCLLVFGLALIWGLLWG
ncbi:permease [Desulfarculus baarsii DSM 2075]|uniref:Permease n=1 Tax=Desulfarculus baarsii (strain ATCC 33931 / DSM 2075 / LMG 7858 / VKM B-1802 / 2st14) TaxID=644282 RepID=E1QJS3_DESB2|nr:permease [Desulfarculus baarsii]ADK85816.1 permease [Desulfarculus baarsii DSM 2075]